MTKDEAVQAALAGRRITPEIRAALGERGESFVTAHLAERLAEGFDCTIERVAVNGRRVLEIRKQPGKRGPNDAQAIAAARAAIEAAGVILPTGRPPQAGR